MLSRWNYFDRNWPRETCILWVQHLNMRLRFLGLLHKSPHPRKTHLIKCKLISSEQPSRFSNRFETSRRARYNHRRVVQNVKTIRQLFCNGPHMPVHCFRSYQRGFKVPKCYISIRTLSPTFHRWHTELRKHIILLFVELYIKWSSRYGHLGRDTVLNVFAVCIFKHISFAVDWEICMYAN